MLVLETAAGGIVLVPVMGLLMYLRLLERKPSYFLFALYLCAVGIAVGFPTLPGLQYYRWDPRIHLIPLADTGADLLLNTLLFVPLGFFLPALWRKYRRFPRALGFGFAASFLIEFTQLFTGRTADINDLIANTLGTAAGFLTMQLLCHPGRTPGAPGKDLPLLIAMAALTLFLIQPFLSDALWHLL